MMVACPYPSMLTITQVTPSDFQRFFTVETAMAQPVPSFRSYFYLDVPFSVY